MIPVQEFHCRMYTDFERTEVPIDPNATEEDKRKEAEQICQWIRELSDDEKRENALLQIRLIKFLMNLENIYLLPMRGGITPKKCIVVSWLLANLLIKV